MPSTKFNVNSSASSLVSVMPISPSTVRTTLSRLALTNPRCPNNRGTTLYSSRIAIHEALTITPIFAASTPFCSRDNDSNGVMVPICTIWDSTDRVLMRVRASQRCLSL